MLVSPATLADATERLDESRESAPQPVPAAHSPADPAASNEVLISPQHVLFSTAAAVGVPSESAGGGLVAAVRRMFARSEKQPRPPRPPRPRYQPKRYAYLEHAAMARAMERL